MQGWAVLVVVGGIAMMVGPGTSQKEAVVYVRLLVRQRTDPPPPPPPTFLMRHAIPPKPPQLHQTTTITVHIPGAAAPPSSPS